MAQDDDQTQGHDLDQMEQLRKDQADSQAAHDERAAADAAAVQSQIADQQAIEAKAAAQAAKVKRK